MADTTTCPACGATASIGQRFCGSCGAVLPRPCPLCDHGNPVGFRFCGRCGAELTDGAERAAPAPPLPEERRTATVVFADLSGFTALSEQMDPEDVRSMVDGCMVRMGEIVERLGGLVDKVVGDELMAVFGAPVSHGDDAERAVRAALAMHGCAAEHVDEFRRLRLRVGVNTGEVMFAPVGPEAARRFTVMGDAVNVASRLCAAGPPGGTLVGRETWRATRRVIAYSEIDPLQLRGKAAAVRAWQVVEPLAGPAERSASMTPMVGRDRELGVLQSIWDRVVAERKPHLVTVLGAAGLGKTRLAVEFAAGVEAHDGRVLRGRSLPYGERTGYRAFAEQVNGAAGIFDTDAAPLARDKLDRLVGELLPAGEAADVAGRLAVLTGLGSSTALADKGPLFVAARQLVEAITARGPTVLLFEDVHWSDPSLLDLLEFLAARCREAPVLFLVLARPELFDVRSAWGGGPRSSTTLELEPLSPADSGQLVGNLRSQQSEPKITDRLVEVAGGNPLFLEELVASCAEQAAGMAAALPPTVQALIAARLDGLPLAERQLLFDAAVVGKIFWRGVLARLRSPDGLDAILDSLEARDLVRSESTSSLEGDRQFAFKHMLIREVAYATLPKAARRERHAAVARLIEAASGDRIDEWASLLAHHWREADDKPKAVEFLLMAAEQAHRSWANTEAIGLYTQALDLIPAEDGARADTVRLQRAIVYVEGADFAAAATELDALLPRLAGRQRAEALLRRARASIYLGDADRLRCSAHAASAVAANLDDGELRARSLAATSAALGMDGSTAEAVALGEQALQSWPPDAHLAERAAHSALTSSYLYWAGAGDRAVDRARAAYALGLETHGVEAIMLGGGNLGIALAGVGRHEEAISVLEAVIAQGNDIELVPRMTARSMNMLAGTLHEIGEVDRARVLNEQAAELGLRVGFAYADAQGRIDLLFADLEAGEIGAAHGAWTPLWEAARESKGFHRWLMGGRLLTARAKIELAEGNAEAAATAAAEALASASENHRLKYEVASRLVLGSALAMMGRADQAAAELQATLKGAERLGHPPSRWRAAFALAQTLSSVGDDAGARAAADTASRTIREFAATLADDHRARFLAAPSVAEVLELGS